MRWLWSWIRCCYPDHQWRENQKERKKQLKTDSAFLAVSNKRKRGMKVNAEIKSHPVQSKFLQPLLQFRNIRILKSNNIGSIENEKKEFQSFSPHATAMLDWRILDIASRWDLHSVNPLWYAKSLCFLWRPGTAFEVILFARWKTKPVSEHFCSAYFNHIFLPFVFSLPTTMTQCSCCFSFWANHRGCWDCGSLCFVN